MLTTLMTPGLMTDAELSYRRERLAADMATSRRVVAWVAGLRRRAPGTAGSHELVLAA